MSAFSIVLVVGSSILLVVSIYQIGRMHGLIQAMGAIGRAADSFEGRFTTEIEEVFKRVINEMP